MSRKGWPVRGKGAADLGANGVADPRSLITFSTCSLMLDPRGTAQLFLKFGIAELCDQRPFHPRAVNRVTVSRIVGESWEPRR